MSSATWLPAAGTCLAVLMIIGCGQTQVDPATASGAVTSQGSPLSGALITLQPLQGTPGPTASAPILDGQFEFIPAHQLAGGTYRVRFMMIPAEVRAQLPLDQRQKFPPADAVIAPQFDARSQLQCQLQPGAHTELEFEVQLQ